jgi:hypothetical protein
VDALAKTWASKFREIPDFSGDPVRLEFDALPNLNAGPAAMLGPRGCQRLTPRRCLRCLGVHSGAHWGVGSPEISMASEYNTGVSGGFRQAGNNVVLSRTLLPVGTLQRGAGPDATNALNRPGRPNLAARIADWEAVAAHFFDDYSSELCRVFVVTYVRGVCVTRTSQKPQRCCCRRNGGS